MTAGNVGLSQRSAALVAGIGLLVMSVAAIWAYMWVFPRLVVPGDAATTAINIAANEMLFRLMIVAFLVVIVADFVVAWALYVFLRPVDESLSLLTAWMRLIYAVIFAMSLLGLVRALALVGGASSVTGLGGDRAEAQAAAMIAAFTDGWNIGYVFFGIHLALLGVLIVRSTFVPKILGALLLLAGLAYVVDRVGAYLVPDAGLQLSTYVGWGELLLMVWLLFRGGMKVGRRRVRMVQRP